MSRSENMSQIKSKDTKPELYIRKLLWNEGFRYRINYKKLPGKPDIFLSKYKTAIFINGCFWHMHENCKLSTFPKTNYEFWKSKLIENVERDKRNYRMLNSMGIKVIVIWGCEIKAMRKDKKLEEIKIDELIERIKDNMDSGK